PVVSAAHHARLRRSHPDLKNTGFHTEQARTGLAIWVVFPNLSLNWPHSCQSQMGRSILEE
ncbi:MAG TPA: hypothetical protein PKE58_16085, partial [Acidobacteriota bacterium]|nr:hypothetical protein [Acidobacteriota bacterium]